MMGISRQAVDSLLKKAHTRISEGVAISDSQLHINVQGERKQKGVGRGAFSVAYLRSLNHLG
jgi:predicted DNA-binding protein (UPF0251 family)